MILFPDPPRGADVEWARAPTFLRYEDLAQDGRVKLLSLAHGLGLTVWRTLLADHPLVRGAGRAGVIPVLSRLVFEGGPDPVAVQRPLEVAGSYQLAHTVDERGAVDRLILNLWATLDGQVGRTYGPAPERNGEPTHVGRVFAEHVFSRLFAPPGQRKVQRFEVEGVPPVPPLEHAFHPPATLLELEPDAVPLEPVLLGDPESIVFNLAHTDPNQHVNSLVYPRAFEEAVLRRLATLGVDGPLLARRLEVAYRKPCFVGDHVRIALRCFRASSGALGAVGLFLPASAFSPSGSPLALDRAFAYLRVELA